VVLQEVVAMLAAGAVLVLVTAVHRDALLWTTI
jgi:hypothetical protein